MPPHRQCFYVVRHLMRLLIFISFLFVSIISFGQIEKRINSILLKRDFKAFLEFAKDYYIEKGGIRIDKGNIREIAGDFQEAMFIISKAYQINKGVSITCNPELKVIVNNNDIIFFELESKEMKDFPKSFETTTDTTFRFIDNVKMAEFEKKFELEYKAKLNKADLFIDTISVGTKCGRYPGFFTKQHEQVEVWVLNKDTTSLYSWLQSANSEKQVYAVKGLYHLSVNGLKINGEKLVITRRVRQKKGTIYTCIPCDSRETLISKELEAFPL